MQFFFFFSKKDEKSKDKTEKPGKFFFSFSWKDENSKEKKGKTFRKKRKIQRKREENLFRVKMKIQERLAGNIQSFSSLFHGKMKILVFLPTPIKKNRRKHKTQNTKN